MWAAILLTFALSADDPVSRAELEARARAAEQARQELKEEIERNQHAIQESQIAIADMKARQAVWGTILTLITGSGVVVTLLNRKRDKQ